MVIDTHGVGPLDLRRVEVAAVMAMATAERAADVDVDVVIHGARNALVQGLKGASVLAAVDKPGCSPASCSAALSVIAPEVQVQLNSACVVSWRP